MATKKEKEKVIKYLKRKRVPAEGCSPNLVNFYAWKIGVKNLSSEEVVDISKNY